MFKSKTRPIAIPQVEHGRMAGTLAAAWGNSEFQTPAFDIQAFVHGVTFHDWHYGPLDNAPIGETSQADWLAIVRRGIEYTFENPITDVVVKLHIKRLLGYHDSPLTSDFKDQVEALIASRLPATGVSRATFEWADRITAFCDQVAFDFSFEQPLTRALDVYDHWDSTETRTIHYQIKTGGHIQVDPWPFSMGAIQGMILGYRLAGYPHNPVPEIVQFQVGT